MEQSYVGEEDNLTFLQNDIRNRGNGLSKAWADLFSLLTTYQARLMVKENQLEISEKQIESRREQLEKLKHGIEPPTTDKLREHVELKEQLLSKCQTELFNTTNMLHCVEADLMNQTELLEKARTEKCEKGDIILQCQKRITQLEADLQIKDEQAEIKDRLIEKLQAQNLRESDAPGTSAEMIQLKELFDMQTKTLDAERKAHRETRKRLQMQQHGTSSTPRKPGPASYLMETLMKPSGVQDMSSPAGDSQYTRLTSLEGPTANRVTCSKDSTQDSRTTCQSEAKNHVPLPLGATCVYNDLYSITKSSEWQSAASMPHISPSNLGQGTSGNYSETSGRRDQDQGNQFLWMPVPISDPVPSTSILRMAAEEAGQQAEALKTRNKGPRGVNQAYDLATLEIAMTKVRSGEMSLRKAANFYNIPKTSLSTYVKEIKKPSGRYGRGGWISPEDEREVIKLSLQYTDNGLKFGRKELLNLLAQYFDSKNIANPFKCGLPGKDWWLKVRKRHPDLIKVTPKASNRSIAQKLQEMNESNAGANESFSESDMNVSLNESGCSADLGLDILRKAAGTGKNESAGEMRSESNLSSQEVYAPLMNMDE